MRRQSINWARIVAQIVYYFVAAVALGAPARQVAFTVPTGNFGDIYAGYAATRMGLPIARLVIATNANDILSRTSPPAAPAGPVAPTGLAVNGHPGFVEFRASAVRILSPGRGSGSQVDDRSGGTRRLLDRRRPARRDPARIRRRQRRRGDDRCHDRPGLPGNTGFLADPHTAVGLAVAARHSGAAPMITLATAHPAKFPVTVEAASGRYPALPEGFTGLLQRQETFTVLPAERSAVEDFVMARTRAIVDRV